MLLGGLFGGDEGLAAGAEGTKAGMAAYREGITRPCFRNVNGLMYRQ